jgi:putative ABC transport system substrate-binding protein
MRRREFITLLGGAAATWPHAARAQQSERMRRIGVLMPYAADDPETQTRMGAFLQALALSGWTIGRNVRIETRWGANDGERLRQYAAELLELAPDVILAHANAAVGALLQATRGVPIVFPVFGDPIAAGIIETSARPGGNVTGFMQFEFSLSGKWLELLKQVAPNVTRAAVLRDSVLGTGTSQVRRHPGHGAVPQGRSKPRQFARRRRDRARRRGLRAFAEWRPHRHRRRGAVPAS